MQQYKLATNGEGLDPATAWRGVGQAYAGSSARAAKTEGRGRLDADVRTPAETENRTEQRAGACAQKLEQERRPSSRVHSRDFEKMFSSPVYGCVLADSLSLYITVQIQPRES
jgi:hypothetical protein